MCSRKYSRGKKKASYTNKLLVIIGLDIQFVIDVEDLG